MPRAVTSKRSLRWCASLALSDAITSSRFCSAWRPPCKIIVHPRPLQGDVEEVGDSSAGASAFWAIAISTPIVV